MRTSVLAIVTAAVCLCAGCNNKASVEVNRSTEEPFVPSQSASYASLDEMDSTAQTDADGVTTYTYYADTTAANTPPATTNQPPAAAAAPPPTAPAVAPAAEDEPLTPTGARMHTVRKGDTLYALARRYYGDQSRWRDIYEANRDQLSDPNLLRVGMKLRIP